MNDSVLVIVRSSGEATESYCEKFFRQNGYRTLVMKSNGLPFSSLLRRAVESAIRVNKYATLMVDADITPLPEMLRWLGKPIEILGSNTFSVTPVILDKSLRQHRPAGVHLYRTKFLSSAIQGIESEMHTTRPETKMKNYMGSRGFQNVSQETLVGLHEFWQTRAHLYQKSYLKGQKMPSLGPTILPVWMRLATSDPDYLTILQGFLAGFWADFFGRGMHVTGKYWPDLDKTEGILKIPPLTISQAQVVAEAQLFAAEVGQERRGSTPSCEPVKMFTNFAWASMASASLVVIRFLQRFLAR